MKLPKGGWKGELLQELVLEKPSAKATHTAGPEDWRSQSWSWACRSK